MMTFRKMLFGSFVFLCIISTAMPAAAGKCREKEFTVSFVRGWIIEVDFWEGEIDLENPKTGKEIELFKEKIPPKRCIDRKPPKIVVKGSELTITLWKGVKKLRKLEIDYDELEIDLEEKGRKEKTLFKAR